MLDLAKMTIEQVKILYPAIRTRHEKAIKELAEDSEAGSTFLSDDKAINEMNARTDLETLHKYFENHMSDHLGWALNELYIQIGLNKYFQVYFHPGSKSFEEYGEYVGGVLASTSVEIAELIVESKRLNNARIEGMVKFRADEQNTLSSAQKEKLESEGFNCREIYSIVKI